MRVASYHVLLLFATHLLGGGAAPCSSHKSLASPDLGLGTPGALLGLLLAGDGFARALAGAGVRARALAAYGQATAVTTSLVGTDLDLAPDVGSDLTTKITFNLIVGLDPIPKRHQVLVGQLMNSKVTTDLGSLQGLQGAGLAYAIVVGVGDLEALVTRAVYYDLVELAVPRAGTDDSLGIWSGGAFFPLE